MSRQLSPCRSLTCLPHGSTAGGRAASPTGVLVLKLQLSASFGLVLALAGSASAQPLAIVTTALPSAAYGLPYTVALSAVGGTPPYQWCGPGPALLSLGNRLAAARGITSGYRPADGILSGIPQGGASAASGRSAGFCGQDGSFQLLHPLNIPPDGTLLVATSSMPVGLLDQPYNSNLAAAGGMPPYSHDPNAGTPSSAGWLVVDTTAGRSRTDMGADLVPRRLRD